MKRLLACLALCASLSASAQDDSCTVLGVQELSILYHQLNQNAAQTLGLLDTIQTLFSGSDTLYVKHLSDEMTLSHFVVNDTAYNVHHPGSGGYTESVNYTIGAGQIGEVLQIQPQTGWSIDGVPLDLTLPYKSLMVGPGQSLYWAIWTGGSLSYDLRERVVIKVYDLPD